MRLEAKVALAVLDGVARVRIARADSVVAVSELVRRERPRVRKYKGILTTENRSWFLGGKQTRDTCAGRERNRRGTIQSLWLPSGRDRRADSQRSIVPRGESELARRGPRDGARREIEGDLSPFASFREFPGIVQQQQQVGESELERDWGAREYLDGLRPGRARETAIQLSRECPPNVPP
jgi:hypothetical protein